MQFNIHAAKSQLSKLIEDSLAGKEVIIAKGSTPVVRLVPIPQAGFKTGTLEGKLGPVPADFFEPMSEQELTDWECR